jgi:catechol 2,3-dioxygenase-like lactoylglutathione lyase family enzyme
MKRFLIPVALVLSACATTSAPSKIEYPHVKRPNLLVADLDRSLVIYQDILGFFPGRISESSTDSYSYPVFNIPREARMRYTYLGEPGEERVFGLTEVTGVEMQPVANAPHRTTVVIGVMDIDDKITRLKALGLKMTEPKVAGGSEFTFTEVAFTDPDGHLIVLYEIME